MLINQPLYIKQINKGYGVPTYGPVPVCPTNTFSSPEEKANPYAYNEQKAINLLTANGWSVKPNGTSTCTDAAKCGVPAGTPLNVDLQYAGGTQSITQLMNAQKSSWAQAGINVNAHDVDLQHRDRDRDSVLRLLVHVADGELGRRLDLRARLLPVR